jgi:hypothetical protein
MVVIAVLCGVERFPFSDERLARFRFARIFVALGGPVRRGTSNRICGNPSRFPCER